MSRHPQLLMAWFSWGVEMQAPCCGLKFFATAEAEMGAISGWLINCLVKVETL